MKKEKTNRIQRVLGLYTKILKGILITKAEEAEMNGPSRETLRISESSWSLRVGTVTVAAH